MGDPLPDDAPKPRLCHLRKWPDFNGYGFNLHAERGKAGQYIGTVDDLSPALAANLYAGDRIIEVNGTNIGSENHQQVVQRIKAVPGETKLLVVDEETDAYYKERKVVVRGDMENLDVCETPITNPYTNPPTGTQPTRSLCPLLLTLLANLRGDILCVIMDVSNAEIHAFLLLQNYKFAIAIYRDFIKISVYKIRAMSVTFLFCNSQFCDGAQNYSFIASQCVHCCKW